MGAAELDDDIITKARQRTSLDTWVEARCCWGQSETTAVLMGPYTNSETKEKMELR